MKLSDYDLRQLDEERINNLTETVAKRLLITLLADLKEARERLNQNSKNSSIPPSSEAPWDKASKYEDENENKDESSNDIKALDDVTPADKNSQTNTCCSDEINSETDTGSSSKPATIPKDSPRKPGKQQGAQGFGREQKITVHQHEPHYPCQCVLCHEVFAPEHPGIASTAFDTLTLEWGDTKQPGIKVVNNLWC